MIKRVLLLTLLGLLAAGAAAMPASAATYPAGFQEQNLVTGLSQPVGVAYTPDGRTLIAEKPGRLKVVGPGSSTPKTVLDISSHVNENGDRGLLGIAVDSSYATNHYVYLLYTYELQPLTPDGGGQMVSRLSRITLNDDSTVANPASPETVLLGSYVATPCPTPANSIDCIPSDGLSHSIGTVISAPDGTLWVGSGDASDYGKVDPLALRTYDEQSFAGKLLHIDRTGKGLAGHPFCPTDSNLADVCTKLHSKNFRNPYRFTLRPGGGLSVGDVGWNTREELDLISTGAGSGGKSYGWPCYEGTIRTPGYKDLAGCQPEYAKEGTANAAVGPQTDYAHSGSNAIIGGPEYTGNTFPSGYRNSIFFGDYAAGFMRRAVVDSQNHVTSVQNFATGWYGTDLKQDPNGDLVYMSFGDGSAGSGALKKIVYSPGNAAPTAVAGGTPTFGTAPLNVQFSSAGSADPDGDTLRYDWDFGDGTAHSTAASPAHVYTASGNYTARLTVDDGRGKSASQTVSISVGSTPPVPKIDAPADGSTFRDGQTIQLQGSATDAEDGNEPASRLSWQVRLYHDTHVHPIQDFTGTANPSFQTRTDHDADSHYEVTLTATDSGGASASKTISLRPETVPLKIDSSPAGAPVSYGGRSYTAPQTNDAAIGFQTSISADQSFEKDGRTYKFDRWSDGGARLHDITVPSTATTLTAIYKDVGQAGIVGAWSFDEGQGASVVDSSPFANNGSIRGATWDPAGKFGKALHFAGGTDLVTVPDSSSLDLVDGMTLEAWVKPEDNADWRNVLMKETPGGEAYAMYASSDGRGPSGWTGDGGATRAGYLTAGQWSHLAVTYDRQVVRLYVNGALVATSSAWGLPIETSDQPFRIGGNAVWTFEAFKGLIDEVRVYDRPLSAAQITTDRDTSIGGAAPVDTTPPSVSVTAPSGGATVSGTTNVTADASDAGGVKSVQFKLDGQDLGSADTSSPYSTAWDTTKATNGTHTLTAVATDNSNNTKTSNSVSVTVKNDTTAPSVALTAPANGATVSGTATNVAANASDDTGVQSVQFKLDGQDLGSPDTSSPYSTSWDTTKASNGSHTLSAVAKDAAGNTKQATDVTVTVSNATAPPGLVGAWSFDEGSGPDAKDSAGQANNGTLTNGPTWTATGKFGSAINFDGVDDRVTMPNSATLGPTQALTLEAWIKPTTLAGWRDVLFKQDGNTDAYALYASSDNNVPSAWIGDFGNKGNAALPVNTWTHLALTYDRTSIKIYVNGVLKTSRPYTDPVPVSTGTFMVGGNPIWPEEHFKGAIDEVRVYSKALTAAEIVTDRDKRIGP